MNFGELHQLDTPRSTETAELPKLKQNFNTANGSPKDTGEITSEFELAMWNQQTAINLQNQGLCRTKEGTCHPEGPNEHHVEPGQAARRTSDFNIQQEGMGT